MRKVVPFVLLALFAVSSSATADEGEAQKKPAKVTASAQAPKASSSATPAKAAKPADDVHEAVRKLLKRPAPQSLREAKRRLAAIRVDVDFRDMDVTDAVDFIGRVAGFNVIVGPELQKDGGLEDLPKITLKLRKASLKTVADLVARFTGTKMAFNNGIVSFTTPEAARGKPVLKIYGIGEITFVLRNFPGPDMNLRPSGAEFEPEEQSDVENPFSDPERVVDMLKEFVDSETWEDEGVSIWADERKLVVRQYPAVQRKIARFLALLNASR